MIHEDIGKCYGCEGREDFEYVFVDETKAQIITLGEHKKILLKNHPYFVSDNGQFDQERVAVEIMYRALFEPSTYNNNLIDRGLRNIWVNRGDTSFKIKTQHDKRLQPLKTMPTVAEMVQVMKSDLGYFQNAVHDLEERIRKMLEQSLPKE